MFYVYVIKSEQNGSLYIGLTSHLRRRLRQHNSGHERSTRANRPFTLLLSEALDTREAARAREKYYKSGFGREILKTTFG